MSLNSWALQEMAWVLEYGRVHAPSGAAEWEQE